MSYGQDAYLQKSNFSNSREYAYNVLRENILTLVLKPGEQLSENKLTTLLQVSRTPIREAIIRLTNDSLLNIVPQVGTFVSKISVKQVFEATFTREIIEISILKKAIPLMTEEHFNRAASILEEQKLLTNTDDIVQHLALDQELHKIFFDVVDNKTAWNIIKSLYEITQRERLIFLMTDTSRLNKIYEEHVELLQLAKEKNIDQIVKVMSNHINLFPNMLGDMKKDYPLYFE